MNLESFTNSGKGRFSQFSEDFITLELVRRINPPHAFLEIGSGDGRENCTRILSEELGWSGVWIDGSPQNCISAGIVARPLGIRALCSQVSLKNVAYVSGLVPQYFGVLSIDIDGNDYWIWKALCEREYGLRPALVIIEAQIQKPHDAPYVMPYDEHYTWDNVSHDNGASVASLVELGETLGYHFVGKCPDFHSPNLFFCRADLVVRLEG